MFALLAELELVPDTREQFLAASLVNSRTSLRDEPGCTRFDVIADDADPLRFHFDERYVDADAFDLHRTTPHYAEWQRVSKRFVSRITRHTGVVIDPGSAGEPQVIRPGDRAARDRGNGARTVELVASAGLRAGTTAFAAGSGLPLHAHNCEEVVRVIAGEIAFTTETRKERLTAGDTTWVPAGTMHRFHEAGNTGAEIAFVYGNGTVTRTLAWSGGTVIVGSSQDGDYHEGL